jgi:hypothetical protein
VRAITSTRVRFAKSAKHSASIGPNFLGRRAASEATSVGGPKTYDGAARSDETPKTFARFKTAAGTKSLDELMVRASGSTNLIKDIKAARFHKLTRGGERFKNESIGRHTGRCTRFLLNGQKTRFWLQKKVLVPRGPS